MSGERCEHEWGADYVCTKCSAIKYASAPMWAACLKMKSGPRGVWLALWSFADFGTTAPPPIWPTNAQLRERAGGISESSLQSHLSALKTQGWLAETECPQHPSGRGFALPWMTPWPEESRTLPAPKIRTREILGAADSVSPESRTEPPGIPDRITRNPGPSHPESRTEPVQDRTSLSEPNNCSRARDGHAPVLDLAEQRRDRVEREILDIVIGANVGAGVGADGRYVADIVRRVANADCSVDDVRAIAKKYKRWKDEKANQKPFHVLFYDNVWPSTLRVYLDRTIEPQPRSRAPASALAHTQAEWAAIKAEPEPELDPEFLNLPNRVGGMT